ncbi:MAG: triose-phosphate isomerase [Candidatus Omnitrophica bacterium CG11_big_fil_rev_8_21_14_0_20_63_9]|nr:MAG: triose-phosphate isomerase [Candidatus Omnitrophica bacterium CG11_big_fil_rev_8_21_14_0_20_63_9]
MRKPIVAGNWKMHLTLAEASNLVQQLKGSCESDAVEVAVCPPFTALSTVGQLLKGSRIGLGAQDLFWEAQGAFTGEVSPAMLADAGCRYVIIGHSERRTHFGETDAMVQRKLAAAMANGLTPIVCIGETLAERDGGKTFETLTKQLSGAFASCEGWDCGKIIVAYEPVWAIGTGRNATPEQAQEAHAFIRQWIGKRCGAEAAEAMRIQYGGSVNAGNAAILLQQPDVDGALVGGASLKADAFGTIVKAAAASQTKVVNRS